MDQVLAALKDYVAIVVACLGAAVSIATLVLTTRLTEGRERRKVLWERELTRFSELEDVAGRLVEDLLRFRNRNDDGRKEAYERLEYIRVAAGRFLRYKSIAAALRDLENAAGWYIREDMKHDTSIEYKKSRAAVDECFHRLVSVCNETLRNAPNGL